MPSSNKRSSADGASSSTADSDRPVIDWINSLSPATASALLAWVESVRGPVSVDMSRASADVSNMVKLNATIPGGSGEDWTEWVTCRLLPKQASEKRHHRIQINLSTTGTTVVTPEKDKSQGAQLKRLLPAEAWARLKEVSHVTAGGRAQVKLWVHHIACRANGKVGSRMGQSVGAVSYTSIDSRQVPTSPCLMLAGGAHQRGCWWQCGPSV